MGALAGIAVSRLAVRALYVVAFLIMAVSLLLLAKTTQNTEEFSRLHYVIVLLNAAGVLMLLCLILVNMVRLGRDYVKGIPGARLKGRMIGMFAVLAAVPLVLVYLFSMYFLNRGIQSYFDEDVTRGLDDALTLSQTVLDLRMREHMERLELVSQQAGEISAQELAIPRLLWHVKCCQTYCWCRCARACRCLILSLPPMAVLKFVQRRCCHRNLA